jgi:hypothetical protein
MLRIAAFGLLLVTTLPAFAQNPAPFADCRSQISQIICLVDPVDSQAPDQDFFNRPCLPESKNYQSFFEAHFDRSPVVLQKMYCHLKKINVEKTSFGTAYAATMPDANGKTIGGIIGIRKEVLDHALEFPSFLSWKEEISFGGSITSTDPRLDLIHYQSNPMSPSFTIDFLLAHEFGHLFDFANHLVQVSDCDWDDKTDTQVGTCTVVPNTWGALSWSHAQKALPEQDYFLRDQTCFYSCNGKFLSPLATTTIFNGLMSSNFVSTYAASNMSDDWAESFAYYILSSAQPFNWQVETQGVTFDLTGHFHGDLLAGKRAYIQNFLNGPVLYPGEGATQPSGPRIHRDYAPPIQF